MLEILVSQGCPRYETGRECKGGFVSGMSLLLERADVWSWKLMVSRDMSFPLGDLELLHLSHVSWGDILCTKIPKQAKLALWPFCSSRAKPLRMPVSALSSLAANSPCFSADASPLTYAALCLPSVVAASLEAAGARSCARALELTSTKISPISKTTIFHVIWCWSPTEPS